jgi:hypothetical protein
MKDTSAAKEKEPIRRRQPFHFLLKRRHDLITMKKVRWCPRAQLILPSKASFTLVIFHVRPNSVPELAKADLS